jgi:trimeric autotransporter adhesin
MRTRLVLSRAALAALLALAVSACSDPTATTPTTVAANLTSLVLSSNAVLGGTTVTATLTLSAAAPSGGAIVTIASSTPSATVPATVTVAGGSTSQSFGITTTNTSATTVITATYNATSQTSTLVTTTVVTAALQGVVLSTNVSVPGIPVQGTVTLSAPAATGGAVIVLASSTASAQVPPSVVVPLGNISQSFQINVLDAKAPAAIISASYAGVVQSASLTIGQFALSLGLSSVAGGVPALGIITLPSPAPGAGISVALASDNAVASVPGSVFIAGGTTSQTFSITTQNAPPTRTATITATYGGVSQSAVLTVVAFPTVTVLTCAPTTLSGGGTVQCSGTLSGPSPSGGWTMAFATSDPSLVAPPSLTVPAGASTFQFAMATNAVTTSVVASLQVFDAQSGLPLWGQVITVNP